MNLVDLYISIFVAFFIGAIVISIILFFNFRKAKKIDLVQGKLANSDSSIASVVSYLKITNEWSTTNGTE